MVAVATTRTDAKRILVVDDEHNILDLITRALGVAGYETITADSALDGLLALQDNPVSLIITDVRMPGMDGLDLIRQVREINPDVPVAVISGYGTWEMARSALEHGAFYFVNKPFSVESIQEVVRKGLRMPSPGVKPSAKLISKTRQTIEMMVVPEQEMVKSACALLCQTARAMGYDEGVSMIKAPFVLDELLVNENKWRKGRSAGKETRVEIILEAGKITIEVESPERVFTDERLPKDFFEIDFGENLPPGMRMILQFTDSIQYESEGRKARVILSCPPLP